MALKSVPETPQKLWKRPNSARVLSIYFFTLLFLIPVVYESD
jgi:hypothetical protein